jgi:cell division control protein 45
LENLFGGGLEGRERIWVWGDDERSARAMEKERKAFEALEVSASLSFLLLRSLCT